MKNSLRCTANNLLIQWFNLLYIYLVIRYPPRMKLFLCARYFEEKPFVAAEGEILTSTGQRDEEIWPAATKVNVKLCWFNSV